jgi:hypothetical protein
MVYEELPVKTKLEWLELAVKTLALCPRLTAEINTREDLIEKIDEFAKDLKIFYSPN